MINDTYTAGGSEKWSIIINLKSNALPGKRF